MHNEIYSDGIGEITVNGTVVRIDLVSLSPTERDAAGNPKPAFRQRIIMPIDVFANSAELVQKAFQGLLDAGAIARTPSSHEVIGSSPGEVDGSRRGSQVQSGLSNGSPNFN